MWVFGGYRTRLGPYRVILDGHEYDEKGYEDGQLTNYDAVLFQKTSMKAQLHQLELINTSKDPERPILDISHVSG